MAQEKIEIQFSPKGDAALIRAIKELDIATKRLQGQTSKYEKELRQLRRAQKRFNKVGLFGVRNLRNMGKATGRLIPKLSVLRSKLLIFSFATGLASAAVSRLTDKFAIQEKAEKSLSTALGRSSKALTNYASALQQATTFGDEEIINAQALLAAYTDDEEQIKKATKATLDLAEAKGMDLNTAADLVGKSFGSSTNALSRYGIQVSGTVGSTARLDSLTRNLSALYGGQATAAADTFSGALQQTSNAIGDANEAIGKAFAPTIQKVAGFLKDGAERVREFMLSTTETDLETAVRQIEELGGNADDLRLKLFTTERNEIKEELDKINEGTQSNLVFLNDQVAAENALKQSKEKELELNNLIAEESIRLGNVEELRAKARGDLLKTEFTRSVAAGKRFTDESLFNQRMAQADLEHLENLIKQRDAAKNLTKEEQARLDLFLKLEAANNKILTLQDKMNSSSQENTTSFFEFLESIDQRLLDTAEKFATTFGEIGAMVEESAQARIDANNAAADAEIEAEKKTRKFQRMSAKQQQDREKEIRDRTAKDNEKQSKEANKLKAAEFRINQAIKIRETIMATQKAFLEASPNIFLQALVAAQGAAAIGVIASQKPPKMERGGLVGGRRHSQGGTMIEAEQGEFVMSRNAVDAIGIENLNRMNMGGGNGANVTFSGNVMSDDFIENEAIPKIKEAVRRGSDIGAS